MRRSPADKKKLNDDIHETVLLYTLLKITEASKDESISKEATAPNIMPAR